MTPAEEIAQGIVKALSGGKLVGAQTNLGPVPTITLVFEDAQERRGQITFWPSLLLTTNIGAAEIKAQININFSEFQK